MPTDNVSEPTEEARRAAEKIRESFYAKDLDRGYGQCPPRMLLSDAELAQIIDSETRCGEMRKALRDAQGMIAFLCCCIHSGESLSAEDERMVDNVIKAIRNALNGGPQ